MNDRELLEKAAKAAGISVIQPHKIGPVDDPAIDYGGYEIEGKRVYWNPLTDDGDALRLAVKLYKYDAFKITDIFDAQFGEYDPYAATRRAIVRAAAAIGELK